MTFFTHTHISGHQYIGQQYGHVYNEAMFIFRRKWFMQQNNLKKKKRFVLQEKINQSVKE